MTESLPIISNHHLNDVLGVSGSLIPGARKKSPKTTLPYIYSPPRMIAVLKYQNSLPPIASVNHSNRPPSSLVGRSLIQSDNTISTDISPILRKHDKNSHKRMATISNSISNSPNPAHKRHVTLHSDATPQIIQRNPLSSDFSQINSPDSLINDEANELETNFFRLTGKTRNTLQKYEKYLDLCNYSDLDKMNKIENMRKKLFNAKNRSKNYSFASAKSELSNVSFKSSLKNPIKFELDYSIATPSKVVDTEHYENNHNNEDMLRKLHNISKEKQIRTIKPPKVVKTRSSPRIRLEPINPEDFFKERTIDRIINQRFSKIEPVKNSLKSMGIFLARSYLLRKQRENQDHKEPFDPARFFAEISQRNEIRKQRFQEQRLKDLKLVIGQLEKDCDRQNKKLERIIGHFTAGLNGDQST